MHHLVEGMMCDWCAEKRGWLNAISRLTADYYWGVYDPAPCMNQRDASFVLPCLTNTGGCWCYQTNQKWFTTFKTNPQNVTWIEWHNVVSAITFLSLPVWTRLYSGDRHSEKIFLTVKALVVHVPVTMTTLISGKYGKREECFFFISTPYLILDSHYSVTQK